MFTEEYEKGQGIITTVKNKKKSGWEHAKNNRFLLIKKNEIEEKCYWR